MQREQIRSGNEDEGETRTRGNILGQDQIGINRSCVRTGSDSSYERSIVQSGEQRGSIRSGDEDEREREQEGNIPGQDWIRVGRSCVRTGSDTLALANF